MVHEVTEVVDQGRVLSTRSLDMRRFTKFYEFKCELRALERALLVETVREWCSDYSQAKQSRETF